MNSGQGLLAELVAENYGPFIGSSISASEQDAFDATYRKRFRFMNRESGSD